MCLPIGCEVLHCLHILLSCSTWDTFFLVLFAFAFFCFTHDGLGVLRAAGILLPIGIGVPNTFVLLIALFISF